MALRFRLRAPSSVPIEVEGVTPDALLAKSLSEIERWPIYHGNRRETLAEFFDVSGDPADGTHEWEGDLSGVHWIGAKMRSGCVRIAGRAGRHLGSEMSGGEIRCEGDAGDWVGGEMHGGLIRVLGRAGHLIGAAYRGSARGMTKGTILIHGDAGNEVGHTQRRGLIVVGGQAGDLVGFNLRAGTILLFGDSGIRHGAGMRRGTIGFLGPSPAMLPTFRRACRYRPDVLRLLFASLRRLQFPLPEAVLEAEFDLYNGDCLEGGRGEILVRQ